MISVYYLGSLMDFVVIGKEMKIILFFFGFIFFSLEILIIEGVFNFECSSFVIVSYIEGIVCVCDFKW